VEKCDRQFAGRHISSPKLRDALYWNFILMV